MTRSLVPALAALGACAALAAAPMSGPPAAPAELRPPQGEQLVLKAHARGVQVYVCSAGAWTLKGPDADLRDERGALIGHHSVGPSWRLTDGSEVTGKAVAHVDAPDGKSIAWLLLSVTAHTGSGTLTQVTSVQRLHTRGGQAPASCTGASPAELRVPYRADYYFYAPGAH
jgi:Protein of unknown function (DUF3455)